MQPRSAAPLLLVFGYAAVAIAFMGCATEAIDPLGLGTGGTSTLGAAGDNAATAGTQSTVAGSSSGGAPGTGAGGTATQGGYGGSAAGQSGSSAGGNGAGSGGVSAGGVGAGGVGAGGGGGKGGSGGSGGSAAGSGGSAGMSASGAGGGGGGGAVEQVLSLNKTAIADSEQTTQANLAINGNDASATTRWCAANGALGHYWQVDLGASYTVTKVSIVWEKAAAYQYKVEGSLNGSAWSLLVDQTATTDTTQTRLDVLGTPTQARYVKVTVTGLPATGAWASFFDLTVSGHP
jgi:F5/8 type C domain